MRRLVLSLLKERKVMKERSTRGDASCYDYPFVCLAWLL